MQTKPNTKMIFALNRAFMGLHMEVTRVLVIIQKWVRYLRYPFHEVQKVYHIQEWMMGIGLFFKATLSIIPRVNFGIRHFLRHLLFSMSILGIPMCLEASPISKVNIVRPHMNTIENTQTLRTRNRTLCLLSCFNVCLFIHPYLPNEFRERTPKLQWFLP